VNRKMYLVSVHGLTTATHIVLGVMIGLVLLVIVRTTIKALVPSHVWQTNEPKTAGATAIPVVEQKDPECRGSESTTIPTSPPVKRKSRRDD
jgi:hypothetical protein